LGPGDWEEKDRNMSKEPFDVVGRIMDYESDQLGTKETIELFQYLVDTGMVNQLQGHYGRMAKTLIQAGHIKRPKAKAT
jgi:hypothetical protein